MFHKLSRNLLVADDGVSEAVTVAQAFISARKGRDGTQTAIREVARECRLGPSRVRSLVHPSKYPKDISLGVWRRLRTGYLAFLYRQKLEIEARIEAIEKMAEPSDLAARSLLDEAKALQRRIETLL